LLVRGRGIIWGSSGKIEHFSLNPYLISILFLPERIFCNSSPEHHYPLNIKLMLTVKKIDESQNLGFPFTLELGKDFSVSLFGESFRDKLAVFSNRSAPQPIRIAGNWETEIAQKALTDAAKFYDANETPQEIGLRAARRVCSINR